MNATAVQPGNSPWPLKAKTELKDDPLSQRATALAKKAYESFYQSENKWDDLNPMVREQWIEITVAVLRAIKAIAA